MKTLTTTQKTILRLAKESGTVPAGRGGWNTVQVKKLEAMGLVRFVRAGAFDATYRLTDAGRTAAGEAHAAWKATVLP